MRTFFRKIHATSLIAGLLLTALVCVMASLSLLAEYIRQNQLTLTKVRMREVAVQNVYHIRTIVGSHVRYIDSLAKMLAKFDDLRSEEARAFLQQIAMGGKFDNLSVDFLEDITDAEYLKKVTNGESFIAMHKLRKNRFDSSFVSPIVNGGKITGAVRGTLNPTTLSGVLDIHIFEGEGYSLLLDQNGEHLAVDENANVQLIDLSFLDAAEIFKFDEGYSTQEVKRDFANRREGFASYSNQENERYAYYMPIGINDWVFLVVILTHKAERDQLTSLYNKITTENLIKKAIDERDSESGLHALIIIDIDNFKEVNDRYGHLAGDALLADISYKLKSLFRVNDIIGRIGGDEFFVFMKNVMSEGVVTDKAHEINAAFRDCKTSASIGIAFFPKHGDTFETLYESADNALYAAKSKGKDTFVVYTPIESL